MAVGWARGIFWVGLANSRRGSAGCLHLVLMLVIFGFVLAALHTSIPIVPHSAALVIAPEGELVEQLSSDPVRRALGQASGGPAPETLLRDVTDAIAAAKSDSRIKLIVLDLERPGFIRPVEAAGDRHGAARVSRLRQACGRRRRDSLDQTQYYLAAQAGEVYLDPMGMVYLDGFSYYRMFLKDAIDKLERRCQCVPRRHLQELYRPIFAQRHGAERARRKLGVAGSLVERLPAGRHARPLAAAPAR